MLKTLLSLRGNPRACVYTEPLWGIPYNLYAPYVSVYMAALGLTDPQIGALASLSLGLQVLTSLLGGPVTDKFGRRLTTFISDLLSWTIPILIWALAQNFWYFVVAVFFNSLWRVSRTCLLVEDADQSKLVSIWSWIYIAGLVAAFFAPLAGLLIGRFDLVPTVRGLYLLAFIMMTIKFVVLFITSHETERGVQRITETRGQPIWSLFGGYREAWRELLGNRRTLTTLAILLIISITVTVNNAFWGILVTKKLGVPSEWIAVFPVARSLVILAMLFFVIPLVSVQRFHLPMALGFGSFIAAVIILVSVPASLPFFALIGLLCLSVIFDAIGGAVVQPLLDSMMVLTVDPRDRARITALIYMIALILTSPFGWIAGQLSTVERILPFALNGVLYVVAIVLIYLNSRAGRQGAVQQANSQDVDGLPQAGG